MRVDKFPDAGTKVQASEFLITSGGQAGNAAVAIARLGGRVSFAGPLGAKDDEFAGRILQSLMREKIDCSGAIRVAGATSSVSLILIDANGEKTIATRRDQGLSSIEPEHRRACSCECRRGASRQSLSEFRDPDLQGGAGARYSAGARPRQGGAARRSAVTGLQPRDLLGGGIARHHRAERSARRAQKARAVFQRLPGFHRRPGRCLLARKWRDPAHGCVQGEGDRYARRR